MEMAILLAERGRGFVSPNPMVGAVVVKDGKVVGRGWHQKYGEPHAEVNAINDAGELARGADIYVTLEPCNHTGKTPPCTEKILSAGIKRVFSAMNDPNPTVKGGGNDYLRSRGVEVFTGLCEKEATKQNEAFIKFIKTGKPFVIVKCASTLDGRTATRTGDSKWITNEESRRYVHELRHACDAIMVGIGTVKADDPRLTARLEGIMARDPVRVILDPFLEIDPGASVFAPDSGSGTILICSESASEEKADILASGSTMIIRVNDRNGMLDLQEVMQRLGEMRIASVLVEGGSTVSASSFSSGIVDKVNFFYAPAILGGDDGYPVCRGKGPELMKDAIRLRDVSIRNFGTDVMIEGYI
jgi:diaminohydroxyphosphoribosylaminopyrimidine deaminase/5-amino-6-(5-phosphoribosylamino)uracil reductase